MNAPVVVDASLALKWVLDEPYSAQARELLSGWRERAVDLLAPTLFVYEVANVLYRRMARGQLTRAQADDALGELTDVGPWLEGSSGLSKRACDLAVQFGRPTAYDTHYLALAEQAGAPCWTADERLWNAVRARLPWVRWVGEPASAGPVS